MHAPANIPTRDAGVICTGAAADRVGYGRLSVRQETVSRAMIWGPEIVNPPCRGMKELVGCGGTLMSTRRSMVQRGSLAEM